MTCKKCGTQSLRVATYCRRCGAPLVEQESPTTHTPPPMYTASPAAAGEGTYRENIARFHTIDKRSKIARLWTIGVVALVVIAIIVAVVVSSNRESNNTYDGWGYEDELEPQGNWWDDYEEYVYEPEPVQMVSADGYFISSGSTVYYPGGGWSLSGSARQGVVNQKADGSWSVTWVAVLERDGYWQWYPPSPIYNGGFATYYWSFNTDREAIFTTPDITSLNQLYIQLDNAASGLFANIFD